MEIIESHVRTDSETFRLNRERMSTLVDELGVRTSAVHEGGGPRYVKRHRQQGKLPVRERVARLLDDGSPFLELSALAAYEMYEGRAPSAGIVTGIGRVSGRDAGSSKRLALHVQLFRAVGCSADWP